MPKFQLPEILSSLIGQSMPVEVNACQLDDAFNDLFSKYPKLEPQILTAEGAIHPFIMVFIGKHPTTQLKGMKSTLEEDDLITLLYNISGG